MFLKYEDYIDLYEPIAIKLAPPAVFLLVPKCCFLDIIYWLPFLYSEEESLLVPDSQPGSAGYS